MVKTIFLLIALSQLLYPALQYLERSTVPESAFEYVNKQWKKPQDDTSTQVNIGFNFPFNNTSYNKIRINTNGALTFDNNDYFDYRPQELPYKNNSIMPYWYDFNPEEGGTIRYGKLGNGDNKRFVITWENLPRYYDSGRYSVQAVLYQDGTIRFRYDASSDASSQINESGCGYWWTCMGASIGVQESSSFYDQYSYNAPIDPTLDVLYSPIKNITMKKISCTIKDPINQTNNPKRIPGATIRYAVEVTNKSASMTNVIVEDNLNSLFDTSTINHLQIQNGACDCLGTTSTNNNGSNGSNTGVNPVRLDFGTISSGTLQNPQIKCGYFEVKLR